MLFVGLFVGLSCKKAGPDTDYPLDSSARECPELDEFPNTRHCVVLGRTLLCPKHVEGIVKAVSGKYACSLGPCVRRASGNYECSPTATGTAMLNHSGLPRCYDVSGREVKCQVLSTSHCCRYPVNP